MNPKLGKYYIFKQINRLFRRFFLKDEIFSDVDDSFGDFLSGVPSTNAAVAPVNIPPAIESRTSETNGAIATNNFPSTVPDVEKNFKKGKSALDFVSLFIHIYLCEYSTSEVG